MPTPRTYITTVPEAYGAYPVAPDTQIQDGDPVGLVAGYVRPHQNGDAFIGFADGEGDNRINGTLPGVGGAGDVHVRVRTQGGLQLIDSEWDVAPTVAAIGTAVVFDSTIPGFTLTTGTGDQIGVLHTYEADRGVSVVFFQGTTVRSI